MSNASASHALLNLSSTRNLEFSRQTVELQMSLWGICAKGSDVCWSLRAVATELNTGDVPEGSQNALRELVECAEAATSTFSMFTMIFAVFLSFTTLLAIPGRCERKTDPGQHKCITITVGGVAATVLGTLAISNYASQCLTMTEVVRPRVGISCILLLTGIVLDALGHMALFAVSATDVRHESNTLLFDPNMASSGYGTGDVKH